MKRSLLALLILSILSPVQSGKTASLTSTIKDQRAVSVTIYNSNVGLVKEVRTIDLATETVQLKVLDVAAKIDPATVHVRSISDGADVRILEQAYAYDLLTPQKLLEKYVGKKVQLATINPETKKEETIDAILLSAQGGTIFQIGDRITIGHPGRILFSSLPEGFVLQPTLAWVLQNRSQPSQKVAQDVEISYLTSDITWKADYIAVLNNTETSGDVRAWVTIDNRSGATYRDASLKLVAGDIHRVQQDAKMERMDRAAVMAQAAPQFREEALFEYHLYALDQKTTIENNQAKQMLLLDADRVPVKKLYIFSGSQHPYRPDQRERQKVGVFLELENKRENHLGIPLPKGTFRVYREDTDGSLQFIGEDQMDHTAKDETFKTKIGEAFDLTGERIQTDYKQISRNVHEVTFEIILRSHKEEDVNIHVEEALPGDWDVLSNSHPYSKRSAHLIRFDVPVPRNREVTIRYRIRYRL